VPPDVPPEALLLLAIIGGFTALILIVVAVSFFWPRGKKVAQIEVREGEPFELEARPQNSKSYRVWMRYGVKWEGHGGTMSGYGLACKVRCLVEDQLVFDDVVGAGGRRVDGLPLTRREITKHAAVSSAHRHGAGSESASIFLGETGTRPEASGIVVTGEIHPAEGTIVESLKVYIAG
jgi:hypothetical protein